MEPPDDLNRDYERTASTCERILHLMTGVILGSFVLIIVLTTTSTGVYVRVGAKALYYLILVSALVWLGTWIYGKRLKKCWDVPPTA